MSLLLLYRQNLPVKPVTVRAIQVYLPPKRAVVVDRRKENDEALLLLIL